MKKLVYLAGPITGQFFGGCTEWRKWACDALSERGMVGVSPMRCKGILATQGEIVATDEGYPKDPLLTNKAIVTRDRSDVFRCDALIVNLLGADRVSIGTCVEIGWADALRKPMILVIEEGTVNPHCHAFLLEMCGIVVHSLEDAIDAVDALLGDVQP